MPWFKIDDGFHCHAKVFAAGTPAAGLYVRCGSWAAQQSSDGVVPKAVAKQYGTARMIKALLDVGLWHQKGHSCDTCPPVDASSYLIHQYLQKNPSRAENDEARRAKSERQQRWREGKRRASEDGDVDASTSGARSGNDADLEANSHRVGTNLNGNSHRVEDELASSWGADSEQTSGPDETFAQFNAGEASDVDGGVDASTRRHGDAAPNPSRPNPSVPPTEEQRKETASYASPLPQIGDRPRIPTASQPLVDALYRAGLITGWELETAEWLLLEALIQRVGIGALVVSARSSWQGARTQPRNGRYFIPAWRKLADAPAARPEPEQEYLPAAVGDNVHRLPDPGHRPSTTDARVNQAVETGRRLQALADAQRTQEQS